MLGRIKSFLRKRFCSKPGPLAYIVAFASWVIGILFTFFLFLPDIRESVIYQSNPLGSPEIWGAGLLIGSSIILLGLKKHVSKLVKYGSLITFMAWVFAGIAYAADSHWYAAISVAGLHIVIQANFYLSAALDTLFPKR